MTPPCTAFEHSGGSAWTPLAAEAELLARVDAETPATVHVAGRSVFGRPLWRVDLGIPDRGSWMVVALQHADEPAGREAALQFIRDLAYATDPGTCGYLDQHRVTILPTANPDGFAAGTRSNGNGSDLNRDHWYLTQPEVRTIHEVISEVAPTLIVDAHERSAVQLAYAMAYERSMIACAYPRIGQLGNELIGELRTAYDGLPITHRFYPASRRTSLREAAALRHAIGLLLESSERSTDLEAASYHLLSFEIARDWHRAHAVELAAMAAGSRAWQTDTAEPYPLEFGLGEPWPETRLPADLIGYQLHTPLPARLVDAYGIEVDGDRIPLHQPARAVIPIICDPAAEEQQTTADRIHLPEVAGVPPELPTPPLGTQVLQMNPDDDAGYLLALH